MKSLLILALVLGLAFGKPFDDLFKDLEDVKGKPKLVLFFF